MAYGPYSCDICGFFRTGPLTPCPRCGLNVCSRCWHRQAKVGHEAAEHGNEIRHEYGGDAEYNRDDEEWDL